MSHQVQQAWQHIHSEKKQTNKQNKQTNKLPPNKQVIAT
jgi:hypothetical protein